MEDPQPLPLPTIPFDPTEFILTFPFKYFYECVGIAFLAIYVYTYILGNKYNKNVALQFVNSTYNLFKSNFAHVGVTQQETGALISSESSSLFKFYASGRINSVCALVTIDLKKRQDLLSASLFSLIWPERDQIQIDIPITSTPQPISFALVRKREAKNYKENHIDLKYLTEKVNLDKFETIPTLILLAEGREPVQSLFDAKITQLIAKYEKQIDCIHFSDQKALSQYPQHLRVIYHNFDKLTADQLQDLVNLALMLVDKIALYKLPAQLKNEYQNEREKLEEIKQKDEKQKRIEEAQKKKVEKQQREKQKAMTLSRDQQIKIQEKEKKEEMKKRYAKKVMHM